MSGYSKPQPLYAPTARSNWSNSNILENSNQSYDNLPSRSTSYQVGESNRTRNFRGGGEEEYQENYHQGQGMRPAEQFSRPAREQRSVSGPALSQPHSNSTYSATPNMPVPSPYSSNQLSSSQRSFGPSQAGFYGNNQDLNSRQPSEGTSYRQPSPSYQTPPPRLSSSVSASSYQPDLSSLSLSNPNRINLSESRRQSSITTTSGYTSKEDRPPYKLAVSHPDLKMLGSMREVALAGEVEVKVAWAKQILKFIERHQASAGASSRISDPVLVKYTDEALNHILLSASAPNPSALSLFLRGDLSSSGSFPSYRPKDQKLAFRDFESSATNGYVKAWFRLGKAYEDFRDYRRALKMYETGVGKEDCACLYRMGMAYLLGQLGLEKDLEKALHFLGLATDRSDLDTPQPGFVLGMIKAGEFEGITRVEIELEFAKEVIERSAYLGFGPAQYKMGQCYEHATLDCFFSPLLSVQYYALASQNGEVEADLALSKWYLCGSAGHFDKNEGLAVTFAEKAAKRGLASAEFALGYYREVGIGGRRDLEDAITWYKRASKHGNVDATDRLQALSTSDSNVLSLSDHESHVDTKLTRKRTQAAHVSEERRRSLRVPAQANSEQRRESTASAVEVERAVYMGGTSMISGGTSGSGGSGPRISAQKYSPHSPPTSPPRNQIRPAGVNPQSPNFTNQQANRNHSQQPNQQKVYQLSDNPISSLEPVSIAAPKRSDAYSSFAEMGVSTQKAKGDDCVIS